MLDAAGGHITVLSGGFPCQPVSGAGKRLGCDDDRWMWPEYARIIRETQPDWIIIENSPRLFIIPEWGGVQSDLETAGYEIQCFRVPASGVGAPHIRERAVVIASYTRRVTAAQTGETVNPIGESRHARSNALCGSESDCAADTESIGLQTVSSVTGGPGAEKPGHTGICGDPRGEFTDTNVFSGPDTVSQSLRIPGRMPEGPRTWCGDWNQSGLADWKTYPPCICRMDDGVLPRVDKPRLQALGNAVVPQVFYPFFRAIRAIEEFE